MVFECKATSSQTTWDCAIANNNHTLFNLAIIACTVMVTGHNPAFNYSTY